MYKYRLNKGDLEFEYIESPFLLQEGDDFYYKDELYFVIDKSNNCSKVDLDYIYSTKRLKYFFEKYGHSVSEDFADEKKLQKLFLDRLSNYFEVETEVTGIHPNGHRVRIDAILKNDLSGVSFLGNYFPLAKHIGIEFKNPMNIGKSKGRGYYDVFAQCLDYSQSTFKDYGRLIVLTCPLFKTPALSPLIYFLKEYNVGYVTLNGDSIVFKWGESTIWSEYSGFTKEALKNKFLSKTGTRL